MNVAVCIDDNCGMLFNSRRQSRDRILIEDFLRTAENNRVFIRSFSEKLFTDMNVSVNDNCLDEAEENDFCFVEDECILPFSQKIRKLIIYKWNRVYPSDFCFEMPDGFTLTETFEFQGSSHEKITREIYVNEN